MIEGIIKNPRMLSEDELEDMADDFVEDLAKKNLTYGQAHLVLKAHKKVFECALEQLNYNAMNEQKEKPITFMLD